MAQGHVNKGNNPLPLILAGVVGAVCAAVAAVVRFGGSDERAEERKHRRERAEAAEDHAIVHKGKKAAADYGSTVVAAAPVAAAEP